MADDPWRLPQTRVLIVEASSGSQSSKDELAVRWAVVLPELVRRDCGGELLGHVDDIVQTIVCKLLVNIAKFRPQADPEVDFAKWMQRVSRNTRLRCAAKLNPKAHARFLQNVLVSMKHSDGSTPSTKAQRKELWSTALAILGDKDLHLLRLHHVDGMTFEAISALERGKWGSAGTLRSRYKRILERLHDRIRSRSKF